MNKPFTLVLVRHGHSEWNLTNRFTGWTDIALTETGLNEATAAGRCLAAHKLSFDEAHVSVLQRTQQTLDALLLGANHTRIPTYHSWRLNERHYGLLQGMNKDEIFNQWDEQQLRCWWRGYHEAPPPLPRDDPSHPRFDPLYENLDKDLLPSSESLEDCLLRTLPYWQNQLVPRIRAGQRLLVISHGNTLRALCMHLENISPEHIEHLEIPSAIPLICTLDSDMRAIVIDELNP